MPIMAKKRKLETTKKKTKLVVKEETDSEHESLGSDDSYSSEEIATKEDKDFIASDDSESEIYYVKGQMAQLVAPPRRVSDVLITKATKNPRKLQLKKNKIIVATKSNQEECCIM